MRISFHRPRPPPPRFAPERQGYTRDEPALTKKDGLASRLKVRLMRCLTIPIGADSVELTIPCKAEYVRTVRWLVEEIAADVPLSVEAVEEVKVAACEAVSNIVRHAYGPGKTPQPISMKCCRGPGELTIEIADHGVGFSVPRLRRKEFPDISKEGGLGIALIHSLMDKVEYWSRPNRGTRIRMMKSASSSVVPAVMRPRKPGKLPN